MKSKQQRRDVDATRKRLFRGELERHGLSDRRITVRVTEEQSLRDLAKAQGWEALFHGQRRLREESATGAIDYSERIAIKPKAPSRQPRTKATTPDTPTRQESLFDDYPASPSSLTESRKHQKEESHEQG